MKTLALILAVLSPSVALSAEPLTIRIVIEITISRGSETPSRYGDPLRNLPAWELQMIEDGKSSKDIDAEWDRRYRKPQRQSTEEWKKKHLDHDGRNDWHVIPAG